MGFITPKCNIPKLMDTTEKCTADASFPLKYFKSILFLLTMFPLLASLCYFFFFCLWLAVKPLYYKTFSVFSSPASYLLQIFIAIQEEMPQNKLFLYKLLFLLLIWMRNVYKMCYAGLRKCLSGSKKKYLCGNQTE